MRLKLLKKIFIFLLPILIFTIALYYYQVREFNKSINTQFIKQELSFPYYLKPGAGSYQLLLGDLNGLNKEAYYELLEFTKGSFSKEPSLLVVPSLAPAKSSNIPEPILEEDFLKQVANNKGVVLVDNFCTKNWEKLKAKPLYEISTLSPGPFCHSENMTQDLNYIIKNFRVEKAVLLYDTESYKEFIKNFLKYLEENEINYELVQSKNIKQ